MALLQHRRGHAPLHRPRRRRDLPLRPARSWTTRSASSPPSTSPTSRPPFDARGHRARRSGPSLGNGVADRTRRRAAGSSPRPRRSPPTSSPLDRRAVPRPCATEHDGIPLGLLLPPLARRRTWTPTPTRSSTITRQCLRPLPRAVRRAATRSASTTRRSCPSSTPARWRTRAWSPSATSSSSARPSPTPSASSRGHGHRPRDGPHVVRRPGHHALVGRPLAERVLRRVHGLPGHSPRRPASPAPGPTSRIAPQGLGLRRRPAALHPPGRPAASVADTAAALLNFDGISYAKGASALRQLVAWLGDEDVPRRHQRALRPRTRSATPPSPTCSPRSPPPAGGTCPAGPSCGCAGRRSTRCAPRSPSTPTAATPRWPWCRPRRAAHPVLRPHRIGVGRYYDRTAPVRARRGRPRPGRRRRPRPCSPALTGEPAARPAAAQRRRPHLRQGPPRPGVGGRRAARAARPGRPAGPRGGLDARRWTRRPTASGRSPSLVDLMVAALPAETEVAIVEDVLALQPRRWSTATSTRRPGPPRWPRSPGPCRAAARRRAGRASRCSWPPPAG